MAPGFDVDRDGVFPWIRQGAAVFQKSSLNNTPNIVSKKSNYS